MGKRSAERELTDWGDGNHPVVNNNEERAVVTGL